MLLEKTRELEVVMGERDSAVSQSVASAAAAASAEKARETSRKEVQDLKLEAQATAMCAMSTMHGLLQCVGEQAGRIEAKCSLIQQQPATSATILERITRCKRISREDLPAAAERGISLRQKLSTIAKNTDKVTGSERFSLLAEEFNKAVDTLKNDYTSIELEVAAPLTRPPQILDAQTLGGEGKEYRREESVGGECCSPLAGCLNLRAEG
jgi:hypothetical protein